MISWGGGAAGEAPGLTNIRRQTRQPPLDVDMAVSKTDDALADAGAQIVVAGIVIVGLNWAEAGMTGSRSVDLVFVGVRRSFFVEESVRMVD